MSLLALASVLEGEHAYSIIDGNVDPRAFQTVRNLLQTDHSIDILGVSVMAGAQMVNAIRQCKSLKKEFPRVSIVWGGYFPSMHHESTLNSEFVDSVIRGQGERAFVELVDALRDGNRLDRVHNLSYRANGSVANNAEHPLFDPNARPLFPYHRVRMDDYAIPTFVGKRTYCHESSVGCPHKCNFCGVVDVFNSRWKAERVDRTLEVVRLLKQRHGMDALEFHDSDFFVSQKRVRELSERLIDEKIRWWAEGRIDTILAFDDETVKLMERSGCRMIFFGAESGYDETLRLMDKSGVTSEKTKAIASRLRQFDIQPEFSFVMGSNPTHTRQDIDATIDLIYELKRINARSVIFPFIYTPVPIGTIYQNAESRGFRYPKNLDEWATHAWKSFTLRENPQTPWLTTSLLNRLKDFRTVLSAYSPRTNEHPLERWKVFFLRAASWWRYRLRFYNAPFELKMLTRMLVPSGRHQDGF